MFFPYDIIFKRFSFSPKEFSEYQEVAGFFFYKTMSILREKNRPMKALI